MHFCMESLYCLIVRGLHGRVSCDSNKRSVHESLAVHIIYNSRHCPVVPTPEAITRFWNASLTASTCCGRKHSCCLFCTTGHS